MRQSLSSLEWRSTVSPSFAERDNWTAEMLSMLWRTRTSFCRIYNNDTAYLTLIDTVSHDRLLRWHLYSPASSPGQTYLVSSATESR